jgi:hypothetical protein
VEYGIDFYRSLPPQYRNMAVRYLGEERTLSSMLVSYPSSVSTVPSSMLTWLMDYAKHVIDWDESNYRQDLEEHLYKFIKNEESVDWALADAICGDNRDSDSSLSSRMSVVFMGPSCVSLACVESECLHLVYLHLQKTRHHVPWRGMLRHYRAYNETKTSRRTPKQ